MSVEDRGPQNLIVLGESGRPHGLKGQVAVKLHNEQYQYFSALETGLSIFLRPLSSKSILAKNGEWKTITSLSLGNKPFLGIEGITSIEELESILPFSFSLERNHFPELDEDEFYAVDLIGIKVYLADKMNEQAIGRVVDCYDNGAQTVVVIHPENGGAVIELPFTENFFPIVELEGDNPQIGIVLPEMID